MRQQRITTSQQEIYLIYLSDHQSFAASKISNDEKEDEFEESWEELTKLLNATLGPKKTVEEWKTVFMHWKNQLKTRAKKLKTVQDSTEGNEAKLALQKLTDIEKRALKLWKEDFQDKDIASIINEIENKDITITPIRKKRKSSESPTILTTIKIPASSPSVMSHMTSVPLPIQTPITITPKQREELSDFLNIKMEPLEAETKRTVIDLRPSKDIQVNEILDWAKSYNVSDPAIDALFNVLKIKRIKTEVKHEPVPHRPETSRDPQTFGLFNRVFARLDKMENHLVQRISSLERKMDGRHVNPIRIQQNLQNSTNASTSSSKRE